jgi:hypothetical protein
MEGGTNVLGLPGCRDLGYSPFRAAGPACCLGNVGRCSMKKSDSADSTQIFRLAYAANAVLLLDVIVGTIVYLAFEGRLPPELLGQAGIGGAALGFVGLVWIIVSSIKWAFEGKAETLEPLSRTIDRGTK